MSGLLANEMSTQFTSSLGERPLRNDFLEPSQQSNFIDEETVVQKRHGVDTGSQAHLISKTDAAMENCCFFCSCFYFFFETKIGLHCLINLFLNQNLENPRYVLL